MKKFLILALFLVYCGDIDIPPEEPDVEELGDDVIIVKKDGNKESYCGDGVCNIEKARGILLV